MKRIYLFIITFFLLTSCTGIKPSSTSSFSSTNTSTISVFDRYEINRFNACLIASRIPNCSGIVVETAIKLYTDKSAQQFELLVYVSSNLQTATGYSEYNSNLKDYVTFGFDQLEYLNVKVVLAQAVNYYDEDNYSFNTISQLHTFTDFWNNTYRLDFIIPFELLSVDEIYFVAIQLQDADSGISDYTRTAGFTFTVEGDYYKVINKLVGEIYG